MSRRRVRLALGWYHHLIHRGAARYAQQAGWHLWSAQRLHTVVHPEWTGDGFITNGLFGEEWGILWSLNIPVVLLDMQPMQRPNVGRVLTDDSLVGQLAFEHFEHKGYAHFAWFSRYDGQELQRALGFEACVRAAGFDCHRLAWYATPDPEEQASADRQQWLRDQVAALPRPVAILAVNDYEAVDLIEACEQLDLQVPEQMAVMGVGNSEEICQYAPTPLTSIDTAREECGYQAAALLDRMMKGEPAPAEPVLVKPVGVVSRRSTDVVAVEQPDVARAMQFIERNAHRNIGVDDIAEEAAMSRRSLFMAFRKHLGRTPHQEIMHCRLMLVSRLLRDTNKRIYEIARETGFASTTALYQTFAQHFNKTPQQYRTEHRRRGRACKKAPAD